jgi:hypothetical protein
MIREHRASADTVQRAAVGEGNDRASAAPAAERQRKRAEAPASSITSARTNKGRYRETQRLRRFQIDDQIVLGCSIGRLAGFIPFTIDVDS